MTTRITHAMLDQRCKTCAPSRVQLHIDAAGRANRLAVRFNRKGDIANANAAHVIALRAIQQARDIIKGE